MGGMLSATFLAVFFVPLFFVVIQWASELGLRRKNKQPVPASDDADPQEKGA
jgi:multidrug efflux pump